MGLQTTEREGGKYINISKGKLKNGGQTHTEFVGHIIDLDIDDDIFTEGTVKRPYRKLTLFVTDEGKLWELNMDIASGYGGAFCGMAPNIDFTKPVEISPGMEGEAGKGGRAKLFIRQPNAEGVFEPIKWFFTNATDVKTKRPLPKEVITGKGAKAVKTLDWSERNTFYENMLQSLAMKTIRPKTGGLANFKPGKPSSKEADNAEPIDDLPF